MTSSTDSISLFRGSYFYWEVCYDTSRLSTWLT